MTPNTDRLGREGIRLPNAWCPEPVCVATRCSILTGRFTHAHGHHGNCCGLGVRFEKDLTDVLSEQGYRSVLIGKDHTYLQLRDQIIGTERGQYAHITPEVRGSHGYDEWYKTDSDAYPPIDQAQWDEYKKRRQQVGHGVDDRPLSAPAEVTEPANTVNMAVNWLDNHNQEPFFMWVSMVDPHQPYVAPEPYFDMFPGETLPERGAGPESVEGKSWIWQWELEQQEKYAPGTAERWRQFRQVYLGMIRMLDDQIGRLIGHLETRNMLENTVVCIISDHGDYCGDYGLTRKGVGVPECLTRVPMVWAGAGIDPHPRASEAHVSLVDLLPTFCDIVGAPIPRGVQGRSLWPILTGADYCEKEFRSMYMEAGLGGIPFSKDDEIPEDAHYVVVKCGGGRVIKDENAITHSGRWEAVVMGGWKIIYNELDEIELYNLNEDPAELENLAGNAEHARVQAAMQAELMYWLRRSQDPLPLDVVQPKMARHNWRRDPDKHYAVYGEDKLHRLRNANQIHR